MNRPRPARQGILGALHRSGPIVDDSGRATYLLARTIGYEARPVSLSPLLATLERDGLVAREVRGRRCYSIELTDKGRAMVDLDMGFQARTAEGKPDEAGHGYGGGDPAGRRWWPAKEGGLDERRLRADAGDPRVPEQWRLELREMWMELGAHRQRLVELERQLERQHERPRDAGAADAVHDVGAPLRRSGSHAG